MFYKVFLLIVIGNIVTIDLVKGRVDLPTPNEAFDQNLYEEVLDPELCHEQVRQIRSNPLLAMFFADAGIRVPRGILQGNTVDLGNYHQCLDFNQQLPNSELQGKYCMIQVPVEQNYHLPEWPANVTSNFDPNMLRLDDETLKGLRNYNAMRKGMLAMTGIVDDNGMLDANPLSGMQFRLAVCIPKPCTTQQAITSFLFNISAVGFQYTDEFCRLPNDKPWVPGDTVTVVVFSVIGFITVLSTTYDIWQTIIMKKDPKEVSVIARSFSVYTNGRRLMNFASTPGTIDCLDGIRALAMAWVLLGHAFTTEPSWVNPIDTFLWSTSWQALWVTGAHITVDTFFFLSGFLIVYTTVGKLNANQLLKNIHVFWLNRLLRTFPLLATVVLLEATYLNRMSDGPLWHAIETQVHSCRTFWWSALLHLQNFVNPGFVCIVPTWYLAIDVQLHILSPIILYWVLLGKKRIAWTALLAGLAGILVASTIYIFINKFPSLMMAPGREDETVDYIYKYYLNILTRASPFVVGMLFGYIVKTTKLEMSKIGTTCFWIIAFSVSTFIMYTNLPIAQTDWDNQIADSFFNSFVRPLWAVFLGCLIYACVNGYGGPINWFLSLRVWKLHSRLSYAMYLFHYGLMAVVNSSVVAPAFFTVGNVTFKFLAHYSLSLAVSFLMALTIDAPCSTLFKLLLGGGVKKPLKKDVDIESTKENDKQV